MVSSNGDKSGGQDRNVDGGSSSFGRRGFGGSLTERIRAVFREGTDGDLVLDRSDVENGIAQWLRALDLQVLGACRSDERMKPLLKLDISNGFAEDRLMIHLNEHFEASEIGMLARCLCIPLVSIRVGKVSRQGSLLCPTSTRGHLNLTLLPSSNTRISFIADDGYTERLAILSNNLDSSEVAIEEISADPSGRSFLLKLSESQISYFWCSEKSKLMGMELIVKMKDLLKRKPTLSHLTGIHESRLESFGTHLRAYFLGSNVPDAASSDELLTSLPAFNSDAHSRLLVSKSSCILTAPSIERPPLESNLCLSANICKDGTTCNSSHMRSGIREKLRQHEGPFINNHITTSVSLSAQINCLSEDDSKSVPFTETGINCSSSSLPSSIISLPTLPTLSDSCSISCLSPYYCWCPPFPPSSLQCSAMPSHLPILPPLSTLLSLAQPPSSTSNLPLDVPKLPGLDLPPFLSEPFARLPLPVSLIATLPASHSTITPFMSDPTVHIPMIDVCSSGQGYLVSGGPPISSAISPMIPNFESAAEKSARETLRMLLASAPPSTCQSPKSVLPPGVPESLWTNILPLPFHNKIDEKFPNAFGSNHGSQGLRIRTPNFVTVEMSTSSIVAKVAGGDGAKRVMLERGSNESMDDMASGFRDSEGCDCE